MFKINIPKRLFKSVILSMVLACSIVSAQETTEAANSAAKPAIETFETLLSFVKLQIRLEEDIKLLGEKIETSHSELQTNALTKQLDKLREEQQATVSNFREIAAGVDISSLRDQEEQAFNLQEEMLALLKPAFDEVKEMTSQARQKSELKETLVYSQKRLPIIEQALENVKQLKSDNKDKQLHDALEEITLSWEKQQSFLKSEAQAAQLKLDKIVSRETSFTDRSQSYLKRFFKKRGLYLAEAFLAILLVLLLSKLIYSSMRRLMPGFRVKHRSFRVRVFQLAHRIISVLLMVLGPMIVFYIAEDWVLFSLGILILFGLAWTLRHALPRYWQQIHLFLNIGAVREGERILIEGLPWQVDEINFYTHLFNPAAGLKQRMPIGELVGLKSRPFSAKEPWFPCNEGDWVILSDNVRGRVTGIAPEMVQLIERGGAKHTYQMSDFLANSPRNLSTNFRIKGTLGVGYNLQEQATDIIPEKLHEFILKRAEQEGYGDKLLNLRVEFQQANISSLDIVIVADFQGDLGPLYNRLRRAIQKWCVEACTQNGWEIPFPQMTIHKKL